MRKSVATVIAMALATAAPGLAHARQATPVAAPPTTVVVEAQKRHKGVVWIKGESAHFIVYSDAKVADAEALIARLERFHSLLRYVAGLNGQPEAAAPKLELYYVAHSESLAIADPAQPPYAVGLYKGCADDVQAYGADMYYRPESKQPLERQPENEGLSYVFEAYAKHFLSINDSHRTPLWFIDGFAHYMATARFDDNQAVVGMAPEAYASFLQEVSNGLDYHLNYKDILAGADHKKGYEGSDASTLSTEFEARAWILTHWVESNPQNRGKFAAYLDATAGGEAPVEAFQKTFGLTPSRLDYTLWSYLHGHHVMAMKMPFTVPVPAPVTFDTLPASAEKLLLWSSALKSCPTADYGQKLLGEIREEAPKYPESDLAQATLARAEIMFGDPSRALPYLTKHVADAPGDFESQFLLGRADLVLASGRQGDARNQTLAAAAQAFLKASGIDADSAAADYFYFRAQVAGEDAPDDGALQVAIHAWQLSPEVDDYAIAAGLAYAHLGQKAEALHVLHTVADDPHGRSRAALAKTWIDRLTAGVSDADVVAALKVDPAPESGLARWTLANHDVFQNLVRAMEDDAMQQAADDALNSGDAQVPGM